MLTKLRKSFFLGVFVFCFFSHLITKEVHGITKWREPIQGEEPVLNGGSVVNVSLPVTVLNQDGHFVSGLQQSDFQVFENNQSQPILSFSKQNKVPLNVSLVMDLSTSIRNRLIFEKEAAKEFLEKLLDNKQDTAALATFNEKVSLVQPLTHDFKRLSQIVQAMTVADGQTAIYDAVYKVCTEQMKNAISKRRAIVLVTDGADTGSSKTLDQAIATAQKHEVTIYAISTKGGSVFRVEGNPYRNIDDKDLKKLCKETGGDVFFPNNIGQLKRAFELAQESLRNQYFLVYESSGSGSKFRQIDVRVTGKKDYQLLARKGYFPAAQE